MSFASLTHAQMVTFDSSKIKVAPEFPKAYEQVVVTLEDFSNDLNTQTVSWSVNGVQKQSGIGLTSYIFTTGALGTVSNITISTGGKIHRGSVRPSEVDMIWEATDSYTPAFYEGKALFPNQGTIVVSAIPHLYSGEGTRLDPKKLVYTWKRAGSALPSQSGYGKDNVRGAGVLIGRPTVFEVEVSSVDGTYKGKGSVLVEETRPSVMLYENDPLYGVELEKALNSQQVSLSGDELSVIAVPFFFSNAKTAANYSWSMNGGSILGNTSNTVVLRNEGVSGISNISVNVKHASNFMQGDQATMRVETINE